MSFEDRGNLGPPPPPFQIGEQPQRGGRNSGWVLLAALVLGIVVIGGATRQFLVDWMWFESVQYVHVLQITKLGQLSLFAGGFVGVFLFVAINLTIARRLAPRVTITVEGADLELAGRMVTLATLGVSLILGMIFGSGLSNQWQQLALAANATPFGMTDPTFGEEISFYIFQLPVLQMLQDWGTGVLLTTGLAAVLFYGVSLTLGGPLLPNRGIRAHVSVLGAALLALIAMQYWLNRFDLMLIPTGVVFGPGYTDLNVRLPLYTLLSVVSAVTGVLLLVNIALRGVALPALGVAALSGVLVLGNVYAEVVQRLQVEPNELSRERPFIEQNIQLTRTAFGLDRIEEVAHKGNIEPTLQELGDNPEAIKNVRLWDHEPLKATYEQIQAIRRYYEFHDVDIDRYTIDREYRQVMLSARELAPDKLAAAEEATTWVNRRLKFTHGYGAALSPVNEIADNRLPNLYLKDLPPITNHPGSEALRITQPEIYFGEKTSEWAIVASNEPELDFASANETKFTSYRGNGGVQLDSLAKRLLFAWQFTDPNILLTDLNPESRILYTRLIPDRVKAIIPFIKLDHDPYLVILDGRLVYVQDGYTTSERFPYSEPYMDSPNGSRLGGRFNKVNYIRNSVKAVVDAYHGSVELYISDPSDPIIQTYAKVFPGTFKSLADMSPGLRQHLRYPEDLFNVQAEVYQIYHMQDPQIFYNKEDAYTRPQEIYLDKQQTMQPYYVIMRLANEPRPEFILMLPFTPVNKNNANAWLAGRADGANYGKLLAFKFPNDRLVFGPRQIESRIDQDDRIADQFGKWRNSGSTIIRGNLLFVPVGDSYIYVEPIYLQSQQSKLPELTRVVVAAGERIAMEASLEDSLNAVFRTTLFKGRDSGATPPVATTPVTQPTVPAGQPTPTPGPTLPGAGTDNQLTTLSRQAQELFTRGQERLRSGDFAGYGEVQRQLEDTLKRMAELAASDTTRRTP